MLCPRSRYRLSEIPLDLHQALDRSVTIYTRFRNQDPQEEHVDDTWNLADLLRKSKIYTYGDHAHSVHTIALLAGPMQVLSLAGSLNNIMMFSFCVTVSRLTIRIPKTRRPPINLPSILMLEYGILATGLRFTIRFWEITNV